MRKALQKQRQKKMTCGIERINAIFHGKDEHLNSTSIDKGGKGKEDEEELEIWEDKVERFLKNWITNHRRENI